MKDLLRFTTAGSVDDGKSTLIGRLLHDTRGVYDDQLESVRKASRDSNAEGFDLALITDGLRAEREQAITIDVAYRYFQTPRRKFIIADTPGHEQYTRNMATGASTASLAVILLDARHGVLPQSRRHAYIAALLGIRKLAVAVNKMDLVDFRRDVFERIRDEFRAVAAKLEVEEPFFVPVSARDGDNVAARGARTPWYPGSTLLEYLETVEVEPAGSAGPLRFPVQLPIRPHLDFRGYAGQIASGRLRVGDRVLALPSGLETRVASLAGQEVCPTVCLADHIDISRGDMLVDPSAPPAVGREFAATLIWMAAEPLRPEAAYLLKHTTRQVCANVRSVRHVLDIRTLDPGPAAELKLNDIAEVEIETHHPIFFDPYRKNRATGSFILIDMISNRTVAAGMILGNSGTDTSVRTAQGRAQRAPRTPRLGTRVSGPPHGGLTVWFTGLSASGKTTLCRAVYERLTARGCRLELLDGDTVRKHLSKGLGFSREDRNENIRRIGFVAGLLTRNGVIALAAAISPYRAVRDEVRASIGDFVEVYVNAPLEVCEARDPKGLYRQARAGQLPAFTGIDDPYEPPLHPEVECRTDRESLEQCIAKVLAAIDRALER
jgi:bifunctional enzyme CysN/CysC